MLRPGGTFLVASHNPRAVVAPRRARDDDPARVRHRKAVRRAGATAVRAVRTLGTAPFWTGAGYVHDPTHGGLRQHAWTPRRAHAEIEAHGFAIVDGPLGVDHPAPYRPSRTGWYYLALRRHA